MPVRRNFGTVRALEPNDERPSIGAGVAGNCRDFASLYDRCPFQISVMHDFMSVAAFFFLLAVHSRRKCCQPDDSCTHRKNLILFHSMFLRGDSSGSLNVPKIL